MDVFIYSLSDPRTNQIRYIGKALDIESRFKQHIACRDKNLQKARWIQELKSEGMRPCAEMLEVSNGEDWPSDERFWIDYLSFIGCQLLNIATGGAGKLRHSQETRLKIAAAHRGRKFTPEHCAHISAARKGTKMPESFCRNQSIARRRENLPREVIEKLRRTSTGRVFSIASRIKKGAKLKGRIFSCETKAKMAASAKARMHLRGRDACGKFV